MDRILRSVTQVDSNTSLEAREAGEYLSRRLTLQKPISPSQMWRYARTGVIPCVRIGRRVWFSTKTLNSLTEPQRTAIHSLRETNV